MLIAIARSYFGNLLPSTTTHPGALSSNRRRLHHLAGASSAWFPSSTLGLRVSAAQLAASVLAAAPAVVMALAPDGPPTGYRPNVGLCLINSENKVFLGQRVDLPECWQMPQGGVEDDEDPRSAALRELKEETGVTSAEIIGEVSEWLTYDFPPDVRVKITQLWGKEWTGQAQKWFFCRFTGDEKEINLEGDGLERPEFLDWKWTLPDDAIQRAVEFKRPVYEKVFKAFDSVLESREDTKSISMQVDDKAP